MEEQPLNKQKGGQEQKSKLKKARSLCEGAKRVHLQPADVDAEGGGGMPRGRGTGEAN